MTNSPFTPSGSSAPRRLRRVAVTLVAIVAAVLLVVRATKEPAPPASEPGAHVHGAAGADSARPVTLTVEEAARIGVTVAEAVLGPMDREVRTVAQVTYDETRVADVALKLDGWVDRLDVNITGQPVRRGEPLLELYSPMLVSAQQELLIARRLVADVAGGTPEARAAAEDALAAARKRLAYWDVPSAVVAGVEAIGTVQRSVPFNAPVGGIVVEKSVLPGQRVMAGDRLYRIADLGRVWLEGEVFEPDLLSARPGLVVSAEFPALPGVRRIGRISYVYPTLDPETRTGRIRVELANADLVLKPGMYATIRFRAATRQALTVPRSAVLATGERTFVFVTGQDGMFTPRQVTTGAATDDRIEILTGLVAGERVVVSGTFLLDAESNLGAAMGGMGDMPGMDMKAPAAAGAGGGADAHQDH